MYMFFLNRAFIVFSKLQIQCFSFIIQSFPKVWTPPSLPPAPFSEGIPSFWVPPSFWSKFKKLPPSFWQPSKLVHVNCISTLKWRCYILYYTSQSRISSLLLILSGSTLYLLLTLALVWCAIWCTRGMNMKHF